MSESAVCPNCAKMAEARIEEDRQAFSEGVDYAFRIMIKSLEAVKTYALVARVDDLIGAFKSTESDIRAQGKSSNADH